GKQIHANQNDSMEYQVRELVAQRSKVKGQRSESVQSLLAAAGPAIAHVALLTGGGDKPYALGMAAALTSVRIYVDFIGSDDLNVRELLNDPLVNFLNLRGDQRPEASRMAKALRVLSYYVRLIRYAATARPK